MTLHVRALTASFAGLCLALVVHGAAAVGGRSSVVLDMSWQELLTPNGLVVLATEFWAIVGPGGKLHPAYFLEHKGHLVVEGLLLLVILYLLLQNTFKVVPKTATGLTEKEIDQLCKEWEPEPLAPDLPPEAVHPDPVVITGTDGTYATVNGKRVLNAASANFLGLTSDPKIKVTGKETIEKYGVGSCGPRGFYGTIDVHLDLEEQLAKFMGTEGAIIYAYDTATVASIIPAFCTRKDIIVMDEACCYPIQAGAVVSRAKLFTFKHNDLDDLEKLLKKLDAQERADKRKPLCRKVIVVEGVYANVGDIAPVDKLYELKEKYRWRLLVEESYSFGVLGATGRGVTEHFGLKPSQVDVICASMGNALASVGGFCVGSNEVVEHQRLSSSGYCFSASLPPYLATAASAALERLDTQGPSSLLPRLLKVTAALRRELRKIPGLKVVSDSASTTTNTSSSNASSSSSPSPLIHLMLVSPSPSGTAADQVTLQRLAEHVLGQGGVLVAVSKYTKLDAYRPAPSIKVLANALMEDKEVAAVAAALRKAAKDLGL